MPAKMKSSVVVFSLLIVCAHLLIARFSTSAAEAAEDKPASTTSAGLVRCEQAQVMTWRGGASDPRWSNPANWEGGQVPTATAVARFTKDATADVLLDADADGRVAGLVLEAGFSGTLALERDLEVSGDVVIADGHLNQGAHALTTLGYRQSGGTFAGGAAPLLIGESARVNGGVLDTPSGLMRATTLEIDSPGVVRMAASAKLELSGAGQPLTGSGTLDTTTNGGNSIEYTGQATADVTSAGPMKAMAVVAGLNRSAMMASLQGRQDKTPHSPVAINALGRIDSLTLGSTSENAPRAAVLDTAAGFAYFGTDSSPALVIKVRLSDFTRVGALNTGDTFIRSAVIDPAAGVAYFGTNGSPGHVLKVQLSTFTLAANLTLNTSENQLQAAVIDTANGFAYFASASSSPGVVVKLRLSDFTRVGALTFIFGANQPQCAVIDPANGFAYFGLNTTPGAVVKVQLSDFTQVGLLVLNTGENTPLAAAIDPANGFAYFGTNTSPGIVVKINLATFTRVGVVTFNTGENTPQSAVIDTAAGFAYFGTNTSPGIVVKINLATFTRVGGLTLSSIETNLQSAVIDTAAGFAYFGTNTSPGRVAKIQLSDFTRSSTLSFPSAENLIQSAVIDTMAGFAYFGTGTTPAIVVKVRLSDFVRVGALTLNAGETNPRSAVIDPVGGFAYFSTDTSPTFIVKVQLSNFTRVGALGPPGETFIRSAVIDTAAGFAYFGTFGGRVLKVRLSDFTLAGSLTLSAGENLLLSAVIDPTAGFAYFVAQTTPGKVVKVRLSDFTRVSALTFNTGENQTQSAVIDTAAGFAYVGTNTSPGIVVKVQLSDFTRAGALTLNTGENNLLCAVIDGVGEAAYFGTNTSPGIVVKIDLATFTRTSAVTLNSGENSLQSAVIDTAGGFAYFGASTSPSIVVRIGFNLAASAATGNWSDANTWGSGHVPLAGEFITIAAGHTVTLDTDTTNLAFLTVSGTLTLGNDATARTLTVVGGIAILAGGAIQQGPSANHQISIGGPWTNSGTFTAGSSTVSFNGNTPQIITGVTTFNQLTLNNPSTVTANSNITVNGEFAFNTGGLAIGSNTVTLNGNVTITGGTLSSASNGTFNYAQTSNGQAVAALNYGNLTFSNFNKTLAPSGTIGIAGNFAPGTATGHTITGSTIAFNGLSLQTLPAIFLTYNNLIINNPSGANLAAGTTTVNGTFTLASGVLGIGNNTLVLNGNAAATGGSLSSTAIGTVNYNQQSDGQIVAPGNYSNLTFSNFNKTLAPSGTIGIAGNFAPGTATGHTITGSTIAFNGTLAQTIPAAFTTFNNLTISNAAGVNFNTGGIVNGTLTLTSGGLTIGSSTLTLNGNAFSTGGSINSGVNGTVLYNQPSNGQAVAGSNYGNLTFSNFNKTLAPTGIIAIANIFTPGTATGHTLTGSTISFNGASAQTIPANFTTFNNLAINNSAGANLAANTTVNGNLALTGGDLNTGAFTLTLPDTATTSGNFDAVGTVTRINTNTLGVAYSFGSPFVTIKFDDATQVAPSSITVNLVKSPPPNFLNAITRTYTITTTGSINQVATLRFHYQDSELNGNPEATLQLWRSNGATWDQFSRTGASTSENWVERRALALPSSVQTSAPNSSSPPTMWTISGPAQPTDVALASFNATGFDGGTYLEWKTGYEVANLGFNLYREDGGNRTLVNPQMLAGSALLVGADTVLRAGRSYSFWDNAAAIKSSTAYWLESVDLNGQSVWHGPYSARQLGGAPPAHSDAEALSHIGQSQSSTSASLPLERAVVMPRATTGLVNLQAPLAAQTAVKISVRREGWYKIAAADLFTAGLAVSANPQRLQLYVEGRELPINVATDAQGRLAAIGFYGRGLDAACTDARVYWLIAGTQSGLRIPQGKGSGFPTPARSFLATIERKDRTIYFAGLRNGERENFFGAVITSAAVTQSLNVSHPDQTAGGQAELEVALQGVTAQTHRVWTYVNNTFVGEVSFEGQSAGTVRLAIAQSLLHEGDNQVWLEAQAGPSDVSLVDYLRLSYWHSFVADDNALRLKVTGKQAVAVSGFTTAAIRVFDVTSPDAVSEIIGKVEAQQNGYKVTATSPETGERQLLMLADEKTNQAANLAANQPSSLRTTAHAADLVIITTRELMTAFGPLQQARAKQGVKSEIIDIEDIYDEFSFGAKTPQAVKDFLHYAANNWKTRPRYVLLAGDASYDAKNYLGFGNYDLVPTKLIDTALMEAASDDWEADFNEDGIAELAVGRLPVRTAEEAEGVVAKLIAYDRAAPAERVLLVADQNEGFNFEGASQEVSALIPASVRVEQLNRGQMDATTAKARLVEAINGGERLINYVGHGSVDQWRGDLLTNQDARELTNKAQLPVFVMMTCLNGYFADPALDSLAESLLKAEGGGAVAVWASSAMTTPGDQAVMNQEVVRQLYGTASVTLGEAVKRAKQAVPDGDVRRTWILLGDPLTRLR